MLKRLMNEKGISIYRLAKISEVPYSTVKDLVDGVTSLDKCNALTLYKIAKAMDTSVEMLIEPYAQKRPSFDVYKSEMCHRLKRQGDVQFLKSILMENLVRKYYDWGWYPECLYLLAMLDYLSNLQDIPLCNSYDDLRSLRMQNTMYPLSVSLMFEITGDESVLVEAKKQAIPEFLKYNIVEADIRNVA